MTTLEPPPSNPPSAARWAAALAGLFLVVFGAVGLTGPGRIDICDAQTRYEVGRNIIERGAISIRGTDWTYLTLYGRDGERFAPARLPQSVMAVAAILVADATGPAAEPRRHFFFSFHGAAVAGVLAVLYATWFRRTGLGPAAAVGWAAAGVFCTPSWFYATSGFDEILGTTAVVAVLVAANRSAARDGVSGIVWAAGSGLTLAVAYHCKQPLGVFALPALAFADRPTARPADRLARAGLIVAGVAAGYAGFRYYEWFMFPPEFPATPVENFWGPGPGHGYSRVSPVIALIDFAVGPASGIVWYAPAVLLGLVGGWRAAHAESAADRRRAVALAAAAAVMIGFLSTLSISKGDPAWGPRYLTPLFGAAWLFAPAGRRAVGGSAAAILLAAGFVVQVLALSMDPFQMILSRGLPSSYTEALPAARLDVRTSHLLSRPGEIIAALTGPPAPEFNTHEPPTRAPADTEPGYVPERVRAESQRYEVFRGLRFWWASLSTLPPDRRPADLAQTGIVFGACFAGGLGLLAAGCGKRALSTASPSPAGP